MNVGGINCKISQLIGSSFEYGDTNTYGSTFVDLPCTTLKSWMEPGDEANNALCSHHVLRVCTLALLLIHAINAGDESNHCSVEEDSYLKDRVDELDIKIEGVLNHTQSKTNYIRSLIIYL